MVSSSTAKRTLAGATLIIGTVLVLVGAVLIFGQKSPDRRELFLKGIRSTLNQKSLTCTVAENNETNQSSTTQIINLDLDRRLARAMLSVRQPGSSVTTEELQAPNGSYIRYTEFQSSETKDPKKKPDLSKVINVWSKTALEPGQSTLYAKSVIGACILPIAYLDQKQTDEVMRDVEQGKIFNTVMKDSKSVKLNGSLTRLYSVTIAPEPYIKWMKDVQKYTGLKDLDDVDSTSFNKKGPAKVEFFINQSSGNLTQIIITASKRTITLSNHGKTFEFDPPQNAITAEELQERFKAL